MERWDITGRGLRKIWDRNDVYSSAVPLRADRLGWYWRRECSGVEYRYSSRSSSGYSAELSGGFGCYRFCVEAGSCERCAGYDGGWFVLFVLRGAEPDCGCFAELAVELAP